MKNLNASSILTRLREAANTATCEVASGVAARFAARVAVTLGDEFVERIASMSTREQLESLRDVLTREQFAARHRALRRPASVRAALRHGSIQAPPDSSTH